MLKIFGFGKLRLEHRQTVLDHFPTRQVEELLGFLLLQPTARHTREKLITLLWPELEVTDGRPRFSIVLSRLRQMFKQLQTPFERYFETTRDWVAFTPHQPFSFDRDQFVVACQSGFRAEAIEQKEQQLQTAVSLYRADLMEGIYADWCLTEREYLARLHLRALGQLMYCSMQRHVYDQAIEYGNLILQDDPLREETHRALMQCYHQQNRFDLAAKQYYDYQSLLKTELKVLPLPETNQLFVQIMDKRAKKALYRSTRNSTERQKIQCALRAFKIAAQELENLL